MRQAVLILAALPMGAQWLHYPDAGAPRNTDGSVNLAAPTPKASNGKPDLSGIWVTDFPVRPAGRGGAAPVNALTAPGEHEGASRYWTNILADFPAQSSPLQPEAAAAYQARRARTSVDSPRAHCMPASPTAAILGPDLLRIVQTPTHLVMLFEQIRNFREVFMDGRKSPENPDPTYNGYSVGHWEDDTLVIETNGFNDKGWFDAGGHTYSSALKLTERLRRRDYGHMDLEIKVDDPKTFTQAFTVKVTQTLQPDTALLEDFCTEGERDLAHMK